MSLEQQVEETLDAYGPTVDDAQEAVVFALHTAMTLRSFKCVGLDEKGPSQDLAPVPSGWNSNKSLYCFRYRYKNNPQSFVIKFMRFEGNLMVTAMIDQQDQVFEFDVNVADYVNPSSQLGDFSNLFRNLGGLLSSFEANIITKLTPSDNRGGRSSAMNPPRSNAGPFQGAPGPPGFTPFPTSSLLQRGGGGGDFGQDLDPFASSGGGGFGGGGGGMLAGPQHPGFGGHMGGGLRDPMAGGLPRGAVPPGARYDPMGVPEDPFNSMPGQSHGRGGGGDHFRPPGAGGPGFL